MKWFAAFMEAPTWWEAVKASWPLVAGLTLYWLFLGLAFWLGVIRPQERMDLERVREIEELRKRMGMDAGDNVEEAQK